MPAADDHEVVGLAGVGAAAAFHRARRAAVRHLERSRVAAAHAGARRRVVVGGALRRELLLRGRSSSGASAAPTTPRLTPFRKSRRVIGARIPRLRSPTLMTMSSPSVLTALPLELPPIRRREAA